MRIKPTFRKTKILDFRVLCALAMLAIGCHKNPGGAAGQTAEQPAPPPATIEVPEGSPNNSLAGEVNPELTRQLRSFIRQKARFPADLDELSRTRSMDIPTPPVGKHWAIDFQTTEIKASGN